MMREKIRVLILCFVLLIPIFSCGEKVNELSLAGSFYANDCGVSHGGFVWAGEYSVSVEILNGEGVLHLKKIGGLGDPISQHDLKIEDFKMDNQKIEMNINKSKAILVWTEKDKIWDGNFNYYYIGNNSSDLSERLGSLSPSSFPGLLEHYYVELRLRK